MQRDEVLSAGAAVGDVVELVSDLTRDVHRAVANRAFGATALGVGPAVRPVRAVHDAIAGPVHAGVRIGVSTAVRGLTRLAAMLRGRTAGSITDHRRGGQVVGVLNGVVGDRMVEQGNALALDLTLRVDDRDVPVTSRALARAYPRADRRLVVFLHGVCETETAWRYRADVWHPGAPPTHGERLHHDLGVTPLWVRCNSGRRVSANGADLDAMMSTVAERWHVPLDEISLVGHSLGGLIARSAVHQAAVRGASWVQRVRRVVCLGTPHHGADLERYANAQTWAFGLVAETRPFAAFLNRRSVGIKDLRYGNVLERDWRDHHPDALLRDTRGDGGLVDGIEYHVVAARFAEGLLGHVMGDLLVRVPSATGRHRRRPLAFTRQAELIGVDHLGLLNHPRVYEHLREILSA